MGEDRQGRQYQNSGLTGVGLGASAPPRPDPAGYDSEIRNAVRFERMLAVKSLLSGTLVAIVIGVYLYYH
jgi:hypothetical protein